MKLKHLIALLLCLCLLAGLAAGCARKQAKQASEDPAPIFAQPSKPVTEAGTEAPDETAPDGNALSWREAFRSDALPEGWVTEDLIAFYEPRVSGDPVIHSVSKEEVYAFRAERLPRTHYYEQFMPEAIREELLPVLDYALAHRYSRFCLSTAALDRALVSENASFLVNTYRINGGELRAADAQTSQRTNGGDLRFLSVTLSGYEENGMLQKVLEGMAAAEAVVDSVPAGCDEYQTALYLYRYLTDHTVCGSSSGGCFLYDALVTGSTVANGFTETLYYLYNLAGIDCLTASGYIGTLGNGTEINSLQFWNVAALDGTYYQFDAAWDAGLSPADYEFYAVSDAYMLANHTQSETEWSLAHRPACEGSLFPEPDSSLWSDPRANTILWHYRFRNAMEEDPMRIFSFFGAALPGSAVSYTEETEDGWVRTSVKASDYLTLLLYEYDYELANTLLDQYFRVDGGCLSYPLRGEAPDLYRVGSAAEQEDGTWLVSLYVLSPDGTFTPAEQTVTLEEHEGIYYVKAVD